MNMPASEYNEICKMVRNWTGTKEQLQALYDSIYARYDDGSEMLRRIDKYQSEWTMNLH